MKFLKNYKVATLTIIALSLSATHPAAFAAKPGCSQATIEGSAPPATPFYIYPKLPVKPFYQWENNDGYCGETSLIQAGLNHGQWMSQFNARLICGTGLSQTGPDGYCEAHKNTPNNNAQLLLENPLPTDSRFANASQCLANARLGATSFDYSHQAKGLAGYREYMTWVKAQVIAGNQVTVGILDKKGTDSQYDHEVSVVKIGTHHAPTDAHYYDDDVLYFDDHGGLSLSEESPAIPIGAGDDVTGCVPYILGYSFGSLPRTREEANAPGAPSYSIIIPGVFPTYTLTGGDGVNHNPRAITGANYGFSVSGPDDVGKNTKPIVLEILSSMTDGKENPLDPVSGYNYENPMIGSDPKGNSCTNTPPSGWMNLVLRAGVSDLTPGVAYNLYRYEFDRVEGIGSEAALALPVSEFNAHADLATHVTHFVADATTFSESIAITSDKIVVFRCVRADAP